MNIKNVLVRDWMTEELIAVSSDTPLPQAQQLMHENRIRRLPVIDGGQLLGIVTFGDVRAVSASDTDGLSSYELNMVLASMPVSEVMTADPITIEPEASLYYAAKKMLENKVSGLPVVSEEQIVGIITETDIFRAMMAILEDEV